jgi:hypothetical protein
METLTGYGSLIVIAILTITRKIVWHKDLDFERRRADKWEGIALRALGIAEKTTVHAEVTNALISKLPDPAAEKGEE